MSDLKNNDFGAQVVPLLSVRSSIIFVLLNAERAGREVKEINVQTDNFQYRFIISFFQSSCLPAYERYGSQDLSYENCK